MTRWDGGCRAVVAALALAVGVLGSPAAPAAGDPCPAPGGADGPLAPDPEDVPPSASLAVGGGGWGHGVGMSQYGAQGGAELGCEVATILGTFYPGSRIEPVGMPSTVRVGLLDPRSQTGGGATAVFTAEDGEVSWHVHGCDDADASGCATQPPVQPAGATWHVRAVRNHDDPAHPDGQYRITDQEGVELWRGGDRYALLDAQHEGVAVRVEVPGLVRRSRWGFTRFDSVADGDGHLFAVEHVTTSPDAQHGAMERYLWGLAEVPSSWHPEALKAQAIAARSYARKRIGLASRDNTCRCDLYATIADQHWTGWDHEADDAAGAGGAWKSAVNATAAQVVRHGDSIVDAFYSSSHGGFSDSSRDVWGSDIAYLQAVDTSRWEQAAENPRQRWTTGFTGSELAGRFDLASIQTVAIEKRGAGGRPTVRDGNGDDEPDGVRVVGTDRDGRSITRWYSGEQLRSKLGLFSARVELRELNPVAATRVQHADPAHHHRIGTSVAVSQSGWEAADTVVVARADDPADALAGAGLAGAAAAPLLITGSSALDPLVAEEVRRLGPRTAYVLGGEQALSPRVARDLKDAGVAEVIRVHGDTRVETAVAIAGRLEVAADGSAYLVFSAAGDPRSWPDALAVSGAAARLARAGTPRPVLITGRSLPEATLAALRDLEIREVIVVGGPVVVPEEVVEDLARRGYEVRRVAGDDRFATSRAVADDVPAPPGVLLVATGENFPDGLSAGAYAGELDVPFVLVPSATLDPGSRTWLQARDWEQASLIVVGGPVAVSDETVAAIQRALGS